MKFFTLRQLTAISMLCAISIALVYFIRFPIIPTAPYLEFTPGDVPIFLATIIFGPIAAFLMALITAFIQGLTVSAQGGFYGIIMNIAFMGSYTLALGIFLYFCKNKKSQPNYMYYIIGAMTLASIITTGVMILANLIVTPYFLGVTREEIEAMREVVIAMIIPALIPFNLLRAGINSVLAFAIWRAFPFEKFFESKR